MAVPSSAAEIEIRFSEKDRSTLREGSSELPVIFREYAFSRFTSQGSLRKEGIPLLTAVSPKRSCHFAWCLCRDICKT